MMLKNFQTKSPFNHSNLIFSTNMVCHQNMFILRVLLFSFIETRSLKINGNVLEAESNISPFQLLSLFLLGVFCLDSSVLYLHGKKSFLSNFPLFF